jgi:hypothetical protein
MKVVMPTTSLDEFNIRDMIVTSKPNEIAVAAYEGLYFYEVTNTNNKYQLIKSQEEYLTFKFVCVLKVIEY